MWFYTWSGLNGLKFSGLPYFHGLFNFDYIDHMLSEFVMVSEIFFELELEMNIYVIYRLLEICQFLLRINLSNGFLIFFFLISKVVYVFS